jgi:uncharacterized membrane protein
VPAEVSGYIQAIDEEGLLAAARSHGVSIGVVRSIGQFAPAGAPLLTVAAADRLTEPLRAACLRAFAIGPLRTMEQDVEFGFLQIVDIALKAISPAVNDPTTASTCIDHLSRLLVRVAAREPPIDTLRDADGFARVVLQRTSFPRLLDVAFGQIRHYGKADVAVPLRLMRALADVAAAAPCGAYADAVREQARRLAAACEQGFPDDLRSELLERLAAVERATPPAQGIDLGRTGSQGQGGSRREPRPA